MKKRFRLKPPVLMFLAFGALLLLCCQLNARSPRLQAQEGSLCLDTESLSRQSYALSGAWTVSQGDSGERLYCLSLRVEGKPGSWCLHIPSGESLSLMVDGETVEGCYALQDGKADYSLTLVQGAGAWPLRGMDSVFLSAKSAYSRIAKSLSTQLLFLAGIILFYALSLFFQRPRERYLLVLAIMVYSTLGRSLVYALPSVEASPILRAVLLDVVYFPFLSKSASLQLNWLFIAALLAILRYRLLCEFAPPRVSGRVFCSLLGAFGLLILLSLGSSALARDLLLLFELLIFLLEGLSISQVEGERGARCILSAAWALTLSSWCLVYGTFLGLFPHGVLDMRLSLRGFTVFFYELAFMVVINGKFAGKFAEADSLASKLERANDGLEAKVAQKTEQLKASCDRIEALQKRRDGFVRSIVHSLKSTLFSLGGYADMALSELHSAPEAAEGHLKRINENTDFAKEIIETLSSALHMAEGQVDYHMAPFDLYALLERIRKASLGEARDLKLRLVPESAPVPQALLTGDAFYIRQAIQNLVDNAMRHSPAGQPILLILSREAEGFAVAVEDQGDGIAPEDLPHIFDWYYAKKQNRHTTSGLGLGITKSIVERHGGHVEVQSRLGEGSRFTLFFPCTPPETLQAEGVVL